MENKESKYTVKWKRVNHPLLPDTSGLVLNNNDVDNWHKPVTFDNSDQAEEYIKELKKTASASISFEVIPYDGEK